MKYMVILLFEDQQIRNITDELFETREAAALFGLGCIRAYKVIEEATRRQGKDSSPLDVDTVIGFEVVDTDRPRNERRMVQSGRHFNQRYFV